MEKDTTYVALDDSKRKIVVGILRSGDTQPELREIANDPRQIRRLFERLKREGPVAACYEAGVSGYDLHRQLIALGVAGAVIAPALTPRRPGQRIKTDRRDAAKLVRLFRAGELTAIHVLDESEEPVRDLVGGRANSWLAPGWCRVSIPGASPSAAARLPKPATVARGGSSSGPPGTIGTGPPSAARWRAAPTDNPTRSSPRRGGPSSACIAATAISSATASERRWPWRRSRANWWGSSGPP